MCGIAGFIDRGRSERDNAALLQSMTDSVAHRGPDGGGTVLLEWGGESPLVGFGHRRLTIIDLTDRGSQPMTTRDGRYSIIFNGEIYNYVELREELLGLGYVFDSTSDTEVILHAYTEWGTECFARFNGMWAFALFDRPGRRVILTRDRFGKKPLYYHHAGDEIVFGSEVKVLLRHPKVPRRPDLDKVFRYLSTNYRYVDIDEHSFFDGIVQVPKSSYAVIGDNLDVEVHRYWRYAPNPQAALLNDTEAVEAFRELFFDSVKIRLRSDVPAGCFLSGGMDSTSITCTAYKVLGTPIRTFSGVTGEARGVYDESEYIDAVVREIEADHHYVRPDPADMFETVDEMLGFHDEPVCTVTWYSLYLLAKRIRAEGVPVILNGHAGDELVAGYWDHYHYYFWDLAQAGRIDELAEEIEAWKENHGRDPEEIERYHEYIGKLTCGEVSEMSRFTDYSACFLPEVVAAHKRDIVLPSDMETMLGRRLNKELMFETVPAVLRPEDRNTMASSLESRSPFLDYRLAEFCAGLPGDRKVRGGLGKWVLREAMRGILPEKVRGRRYKAGFIAPADDWFRTVNREKTRELIESSEFAGRGLFDVDEVRRVFDDHLMGANHQMFLWQLVNLELWFRRFFDN